MAVTKSIQPSPQFATDQPDTVSTVWSALTGGMFRVRLSDRKAAPGSRRGVVLDDSGNVIGDASDYIYGGSGFCIHTRAYGGYVPCDQIAFV